MWNIQIQSFYDNIVGITVHYDEKPAPKPMFRHKTSQILGFNLIGLSNCTINQVNVLIYRRYISETLQEKKKYGLVQTKLLISVH